jgi:hypothetical protein
MLGQQIKLLSDNRLIKQTVPEIPLAGKNHLNNGDMKQTHVNSIISS